MCYNFCHSSFISNHVTSIHIGLNSDKKHTLKITKKLLTLHKISQNVSFIRIEISHSMVFYSLITFSHFFTLFMPHCGLTIFPNIELQRNCFVARVLLEHIINIESYFIAHKFDTTNSIRCFSPFLKVGG